MPRTSKTTKSAAKSATKLPAAATPIVAATPVVAKTASKAKRSTAPKKEVVVEPAAVNVVEPVTADVSTPVASKVVVGLQEDFTAYLGKIQQVVGLLSNLRTEFRLLERRAIREVKAADKITAKRKRKTGNRSPSGFVKPTLISEELAAFLSKPLGTLMARTEVTREINAYIREHSLQDKDNGRKINADDKLSTLLSLTAGDELTYFNLQKYMSRHFAKATKKEGVPATSS